MECYDFKTGEQYYYILPRKMKIESFIIHNGMSIKGASIISSIFKLYKNWNDANNALIKLKEHFTFKNE